MNSASAGRPLAASLELQRRYLEFLVEVAKKLKTPRRCVLTALMYFRRFIHRVNEGCAISLPSSRPFDALSPHQQASEMTLKALISIYVAGKVEELPPPMGYQNDQRGVHVERMASVAVREPSFAYVKRDASGVTKDVVEGEMEFMRALDFHLMCHHPMRAALYLLAPDSARGGAEEKIRAQVFDKCVEIYLSPRDVVFEFPPAVLGAAIAYSVDPSEAVARRALARGMEAIHESGGEEGASDADFKRARQALVGVVRELGWER